MNFSRREFLLATGAFCLSRPLRPVAQTKRRVLVLGAGLAGLAAAYELALKNFDVTVLEARSRIGGRVVTLREPFRDGQSVELGGELIGDGYRRFLNYADKFGVKYESAATETQTGGSVSGLQKGIGTSAIVGGKLYPVGSLIESNSYHLPDDEARDLPPTLLFKHIAAIAAEARANPKVLGDYDKLSLADALRRRNVSEGMIRLMNISLNYNSIETVSTAGVLFDARRRIGAGMQPIRIVGGNDKLPQALFENAQKAGAKFIFEAPVKTVNTGEKRTRVSFENKRGKTEIVEADKIVCAIPFSVLRDVSFDPPLPEAKMKAVRELAYTCITKVFLQAPRAAWDERRLGSSVWTDTPLERIFSAAGKRGVDRLGIFTVWTDGEGAALPESLSDEKRQTWARKEFEKRLPFMRVKQTATKSWTNDEFARGAYSHFTVGQFNELQPILRAPVGAIHFAGEHTAANAPGMEGALESAERAVNEIVAG